VAYFQGWADSVDFRNKTVTIEEAVDDPDQGVALTGDRHEGESPAERRVEKAEESNSNGEMMFGDDAANAFVQFFLTAGRGPE
jgi:hypothetical protein